MTAPLECARCDAKSATGEGWVQRPSLMTGQSFAFCPACAAGTGTAAAADGDGRNGNADNRLRLFIERIERLEEEKQGISDDIRDTYSEMKATGYDTKCAREIVKLRKMSPNDRAERDAILDTYRDAIGV